MAKQEASSPLSLSSSSATPFGVPYMVVAELGPGCEPSVCVSPFASRGLSRIVLSASSTSLGLARLIGANYTPPVPANHLSVSFSTLICPPATAPTETVLEFLDVASAEAVMTVSTAQIGKALVSVV